MLSTILSWLKSFFVKETVGILVKKFIQNATKNLAQEFWNKDTQEKAYEYVKELYNNNDMTTSEKAKEFNKKMGEYAIKCGKVLSDSAINLLREMAVNIIKEELGKKIA